MAALRPRSERLLALRLRLVADVCDDLRHGQVPQGRVLREMRDWEDWDDGLVEKMEQLRFLEEILGLLLHRRAGGSLAAEAALERRLTELAR